MVIAERSTDRTYDGLVVVGYLSTNKRTQFHEVTQFWSLLCSDHTEQHIAVAAEAFLCLQLGCYELVTYILHVTNAGEWHLLFYKVAEPFTADGIAKDGRYDGTEEQAAIEHGLDSEAVAESERHTPVGFDLAHARFLVNDITVDIEDIELAEVISDVGIFSIEACTTCGETPVVLAIVVQSGAVAVEMLVLKNNHHRIL